MDASRDVVRARRRDGRLERDADLAVGPGRAPGRCRASRDRFGVTAGSRSAVDLVRGLGVLTGHRGRRRPRRDRRLRQRLRRAGATPASSRSRDRDFFLLHVEATDEAGHQGTVDEKVAALERWDARDHRPARRRARRRAVPHPARCPTTPRRARCAPTRATRCRTSCSTPPPTPRAARTPSRASPIERPSSRTPSWRGCSPSRRGGRLTVQVRLRGRRSLPTLSSVDHDNMKLRLRTTGEGALLGLLVVGAIGLAVDKLWLSIPGALDRRVRRLVLGALLKLTHYR